MVGGLASNGYEILYMHVLDQSSNTVRFSWHQDTEENAAQMQVCYTMCVLLEGDGAGDAYPLEVAGGEVCTYKVGHGFIFDSACWHRTGMLNGPPNKCTKLGVFLGKRGSGSACSGYESSTRRSHAWQPQV